MPSRDMHRRALMLVALLLLLLTTVSCVRGCKSRRPPIHPNPNMDQQPKLLAQASSDFFFDGKEMRPPVPGTIARGEMPGDIGYETGFHADGTELATIPVEITDAVLARGQQRFEIYCAACHDRRGTGRGILFERGNVPTTSLHDAKVLDATDGHIFNVITNGQGLMGGYGYPIPVADRWAIVAYVRDLQARHER